MRDQMQVGDKVLFYHSSCAEPGIAGLAEVSVLAYPDAIQFEPGNKYFDPKATPENPRWVNVDVKLVKKTRLMPLSEIRTYPELANMRILQRATGCRSRRSIRPNTRSSSSTCNARTGSRPAGRLCWPWAAGRLCRRPARRRRRAHHRAGADLSAARAGAGGRDGAATGARHLARLDPVYLAVQRARAPSPRRGRVAAGAAHRARHRARHAGRRACWRRRCRRRC